VARLSGVSAATAGAARARDHLAEDVRARGLGLARRRFQRRDRLGGLLHEYYRSAS
jgi:hypothetical protein